MSDDAQRPARDDGPAPGGAPKRRRARTRGLLVRTPTATVASGLPPRITLFAVSAAMVMLLFAVARYLGAFEGRVDHVFQNDAKPKIGTSAADLEAREREIAEKRRFAESLFGPELWDVVDDSEFAEEPEWAKVLVAMSKQDPRFVVDHLDFSLNNHYDEVMKAPAEFRGRFVRMRGLVASNFRAYKLRRPVEGREDVFRGLIADTEGEHPVFFDLLDRPPHFETMKERPPGTDVIFSNADAVDVDGVLYRTVRYETKGDPRDPKNNPPRWISVPWIIARTVVRCQPDEEPSSTVSTAVGGLTAFLALVVLIVYLVRRGRRQRAAPGTYQAGIRATFAQKLREERLRKPPEDGAS